MKQSLLNGYILHAKAYQEKRAIYRFFSYEHGVVHGVGVRAMPLFVPICLMATGTRTLKSFGQLTLGFAASFDAITAPSFTKIPKGRVQYALLYLNEVLYKLLAIENPCPALWQAYHNTAVKLYALDAMGLSVAEELQAMRVYLRGFERALFAELGVAIDFINDYLAEPIRAEQWYRFVPQMGFVPDKVSVFEGVRQNAKISRARFAGKEIIQMADSLSDEASVAYLDQFSQIQKQLVDFLLDYQPLHSRTLWQQSIRYLAEK